MLFQSKVVLVTGGAGGIGREVSLALARGGARVCVCDVGCELDGSGESDSAATLVAHEIAEQGGEAVGCNCDISTERGAKDAVKRCIDAFSDLDVVVCAAGIAHSKTLLKTDEQQWNRVLAVGLTGTFFTMQAAAREMIARGHGGRMVLMTGQWGYLGQFSLGSLAAMQGGVHGLMRTAAIEWQKHKITVNAVAPLASTRMTEQLGLIEGFDKLTVQHVVPSVLMLTSDLCGERTGHVLTCVGSRMYSYRFVESDGMFTDGDGGVFTPEEIEENFQAIIKV